MEIVLQFVLYLKNNQWKQLCTMSFEDFVLSVLSKPWFILSIEVALTQILSDHFKWFIKNYSNMSIVYLDKRWKKSERKASKALHSEVTLFQVLEQCPKNSSVHSEFKDKHIFCLVSPCA